MSTPVGAAAALGRQLSGPVHRPIDELRPHPDNPRRIAKERLEQLKRSLEADPQMLEARPLIALPDGTVIAGNMRLRAARELGWSELPVVTADLDEETARLWMLRDNNAFGDWDERPLAEMLASLEKGGVELALAGFSSRTVDELLGDLGRERARPDPDDAPEPPAKPRSKKGQVYELGPHRLLCGDAGDAKAVAKLLAGEQIDLVVTDPPYGVDYVAKNVWLNGRDRGGRNAQTIHGDDLESRDLGLLLEAAFTLAGEAATPGTPIYVWHSDSTVLTFRIALKAAGWAYKQTIIWAKNHLVLGRQDYQWRHEPVVYGWKPGAAHRWYGDASDTTVIDDDVDVRKLAKPELVKLVLELQQREPTTVIRESKPHKADLHPTMKPVRILERFIANSSRRGDTVYDPFAGAGSTLIAADKSGRRALLVEIDRGYCDVIRDRWERWNAG